MCGCKSGNYPSKLGGKDAPQELRNFVETTKHTNIKEENKVEEKQ